MEGRNGHQQNSSTSTFSSISPTAASRGSSSAITIPLSTCSTCAIILDELQELANLSAPENAIETTSTSAFSLAGDNNYLRVRLQKLIDQYRPPPLPPRSSVDSAAVSTLSSMGSTSSKGSYMHAIRKASRRKEPEVKDIYNLVTLSPKGKVVAATVDDTDSRSPPTTKLMITKVDNLERRIRNEFSTFIGMRLVARDQQIKALTASESFVAVGSDAGFELYKVGDASRSFSEPIKQMVKAVALFDNPNSEDFVCIGTGNGTVYHSRIVRNNNPSATEEPYKLAVDGETKWIEMKVASCAAIVSYSEDGRRICIGSTNGKIYIYNIDGSRASLSYQLHVSSGENKAFTFTALRFIDTDRVISGILTDTGSGGNFPAIIDFNQRSQTALRTNPKYSKLRANIHALCVSQGDVLQIAFVERNKVKVYQRYAENWEEVTVEGAEIPGHVNYDGVALVFRSSTELLVLDKECKVRTLLIPPY